MTLHSGGNAIRLGQVWGILAFQAVPGGFLRRAKHWSGSLLVVSIRVASGPLSAMRKWKAQMHMIGAILTRVGQMIRKGADQKPAEPAFWQFRSRAVQGG